jgi:hypothetical protein
MSEIIPSDSGDYIEPNLEAYTADFDAWEQELASELGQRALGDVINHDRLATPLNKPLEDEKIQPTKQDYEPLKLDVNTGSVEKGPGVTEDELFSAAMGLIYFTTGIPADEVFEERS